MKHLPIQRLFTQQPLKLLVGLLTAGVLLSGCQQVNGLLAKRDNGSLDYLNAKKLPPIALPADQQHAPFTPLYAVPDVPKAVEPSTNQTGKQYQLPTPPKVVR